MKRGGYTKSEMKLLNFYLPVAVLPYVDRAVLKLDTDRSKFVRSAIREKLQRAGIIIPESS